MSRILAATLGRLSPRYRTITPSAAAAAAAWADLYGQSYDQTHLLLMTRDGAKLAVHRYGSKPGGEAYVPPGNPLTVKSPE